MTTTVQAAQVSTQVNASPDDVWTALTTPSVLKMFFFGADVDTSWKIGDPIYFRGDWNGKKFEDKGTIEEFEPRKRLSFTHWSALSGKPDVPENYHVVTFELTPSPDATKVILTQDNRAGSEPVSGDSKRELESNWKMVLDGLKKAVES